MVVPLARVFRPILLWTLLVPFALLAIVTIGALISAQWRESDEREANKPAGGEYVAAGDTRVFVQRLGNPTAPAIVRIYQRPFALKEASAQLGYWLPELIAPRGHQRSDEVEPYTSLKIPVTLIWGRADTITPLAQGEHLLNLIPGAKLVIIPRAGHGPQIEEPALFASALRDALAR